MFASSRSKIDAALVMTVALACARADAAEPLRLRGDALAQTRSPVGLLVLQAQDRLKPWLDAESVTWLGATTEPLAPTGDVVTLSVRARDVRSGSEVRIGRMVVSMGAVRPVHIDGGRALARVFRGTTVETFGGVAVAPRFDYAPVAFAAGGRLGQAIADAASFGGSYAIRTRAGLHDDEEAGADFAFTPSPAFTAAGRASFDLLTYGVTDALASVSAQRRDLRGELFVTHRSPGRLLPSTSLFSVLGDFSATSTGATARWRAAPRLELLATGSLQVQADDIGGQGTGRATLALDDAFDGSVGVEARRVDFGGARWTGARAIATVPLGAFRVATEVELVRPDDPRGRGALWPWALASASWRSPRGWEVATGIEGSSGPENRSAVYALARLSYVFGATR